jgi:hypothetical protein
VVIFPLLSSCHVYRLFQSLIDELTTGIAHLKIANDVRDEKKEILFILEGNARPR